MSLPTIECNQLADVIYRVEGGTNTIYPYGIKTAYKYTTPRQACLNTIQHNAERLHVTHIDKYFIYSLSLRYCPTNSDPIGNRNWNTNIVRILHITK